MEEANSGYSKKIKALPDDQSIESGVRFLIREGFNRQQQATVAGHRNGRSKVWGRC